jgi:putative sterol carrier protein
MERLEQPKDIIGSIPKYFTPKGDRARSFTVIYKIRGAGEEAGVWSVTVDGDSCVVREGEAREYESKVLISKDDYLRLVYGELDIIHAWFSGRLRYVGNIFAQDELNTYLNLPAESGMIRV